MADINEASPGYGLDRLQAWGTGSLQVDAGLTPQQMAVSASPVTWFLIFDPYGTLLEELAQAGGPIWAGSGPP